MYALWIAVWTLLSVLTLHSIVRWISKLWMPACACGSGACPMIPTRESVLRPMLLVLATDVLVWMYQHQPLWFSNKDDLIPGVFTILVLCGWGILPVMMLGESVWGTSGPPLIGWVHSFRRCTLLYGYTRKSAPYGPFAKMMGLTHFQGGFKVWHFDETAENGQRATVTLAIKATGGITPHEFCGEVHSTYEAFDSLLKSKLAEVGNHLGDLLGFVPTHPGLSIEVQKPQFFPPPQAVPAPVPA